MENAKADSPDVAANLEVGDFTVFDKGVEFGFVGAGVDDVLVEVEERRGEWDAFVEGFIHWIDNIIAY